MIIDACFLIWEIWCWPFAVNVTLKPSFHMSGKSQTIGAFNFCRPSQIYRPIATILPLILAMNLAGNGKCAKNWNLRDRETGTQQFGGLVMSEIHRRRPRRYKFEFSFAGMIADHHRNLGRVGKIGTLPILQICPRPSQTIGDIYNLLVFTGTVGKQ